MEAIKKGAAGRMARPKKQDHEKRSALIPPVRVTEAEMAHVIAQSEAANLTVTDYARQRVLTGKVTLPPSPIDASLLSDLNRIGNNLNQIARQVNRGRQHDPDHLGHVLHQLNTALEVVARRYGS